MEKKLGLIISADDRRRGPTLALKQLHSTFILTYEYQHAKNRVSQVRGVPRTYVLKRPLQIIVLGKTFVNSSLGAGIHNVLRSTGYPVLRTTLISSGKAYNSADLLPYSQVQS